MMRKVLIISMILLAPTVSMAETVSKAELIRAAEAVFSFVPKDQFEATPSGTELSGKSFVIVRDVNVSRKFRRRCLGGATWYYKPGSTKFSFYYGRRVLLRDYPIGELTASVVLYGLSTKVAVFELKCKFTDGGSYTASNRMGAKVTVYVGVAKFIVLAFKTTAFYYGAGNYPGITLAPNAARKLSKTLRVRITGTVGIWSNGKTILCGKRTHAPTMDIPIKITLDACFINARIDRVTFFDSSTGKVLFAEIPPTKRQ